MDAAQAMTELTEISSQIEAAVIVDERGEVVGSTRADGAGLAAAGRELLERAAAAREGAEPTQLEVATGEGSVFVLREEQRTIVATTAPEPTVGLVFYDLKSCLRSLEQPKPKRRAPRKKKEAL